MISAIFTGDFENFFASIGKGIKESFNAMTNAMKDAFLYLDPTRW